jgi:lipopolysaccharide export LptBFGC system permease protein LptF
MRILDRYILKSFLVNYLLALCVLVGMYVLMDIIVNIQDFAKGATVVTDTGNATAWDIAGDMADYYLYQFPVIFQQIAGIVPLLAAGFTMVRMTRHNELTAMMASGVSLYRVAAPIILISACFTVFQIVNQEFIISQPQVIEKLLRRHDEVHVQGQSNPVFASVTGTIAVTDPAAALNAGRAKTGIAQALKSGAFNLYIKDGAKGSSLTKAIAVNLPAQGVQTSLNTLAETITAAGDGLVTAAVDPKGKLKITGAKNVTFYFGEDTSGVLVGLGILPNSKKNPLWFIKDQDRSYLSALQYCPARHYSVALEAPDRITRPYGSFKNDGLRPGFTVTLSGFASAADNGDFIVTAIEDRVLYVTGAAAPASFVPQTARSGARLYVAPAINDVFLVERDEAGTPLRHTRANFAQWLPDPTPGGTRDAWVMHDVDTEDDNTRQPDARHFNQVVRRTELSPAQIDLILSKKAVDYLSSERVHELAKFSPDINQPVLYKIMYLRFTQPLMNIVMLLIGIPFLLTREPNRLVINMFYCVAVIGFIFVATFVLFQMGGGQINPLWAAWLPVLIFGPFTVVMLDSVKT